MDEFLSTVDLPIPVIGVHMNAGDEDDPSQYKFLKENVTLDVDELADIMFDLMTKHQLTYGGFCCGSGPEHTNALSDRLVG